MLTIAYRDIYALGPDDDVGQLTLLTSPLSSSDEILNLFNGGLVPIEVAIPSAMHAIGATKDEIDEALRKAKERESNQANQAGQANQVGQANQETPVSNHTLKNQEKYEPQRDDIEGTAKDS